MERQFTCIAHRCITLHMYAYPFDLLPFDAGKDGRVRSLAEEQCITWTQNQQTNTVSAERQHEITLSAINQTVIASSPDLDLTITLIRLLTGSKFST